MYIYTCPRGTILKNVLQARAKTKEREKKKEQPKEEEQVPIQEGEKARQGHSSLHTAGLIVPPAQVVPPISSPHLEPPNQTHAMHNISPNPYSPISAIPTPKYLSILGLSSATCFVGRSPLFHKQLPAVERPSTVQS